MEEIEEFYTINENQEAEIVEKKSRFIAHLFYVETIEEAEKNIKEIKKKYHDARHNTFAYAIETGDRGIAIKFNDDGEPSGTAGSPMLKVLLEKNLTNVLVVVTRYFGGTLLGTGGLVRAYTNVTLKALENTQIVKKTYGYEVKIQINYEDLEKIRFYLKTNQIKILNVKFLKNIEIILEISKKNMEKIVSENDKRKLNISKFDILRQKYV